MSPAVELSLFVVVPIYNNWEDTQTCVRMLGRQSNTDFQVILADDGSPLPPPATFSYGPGFTYVRHKNLGFAGNCNRAAAMALEAGATHVLLLNTDTEFNADFIAGWHENIARHDLQIATPIVHWHSEPDEIWFSGGAHGLRDPFFRLRKDFKTPTRVDVICGCCMMISAEAWRKLGGFDPIYRMYFEDFDFCVRAARAEIPVHVVPDSRIRVWHKVGGSSAPAGLWALHYALLESRLIYLRRSFSIFAYPFLLVLTFLHLCAMITLHLPNIPSARRLWNSIRAGFLTPLPKRF